VFSGSFLPSKLRGQHTHPERFAQPGHLGANMAQPNDANGLAPQRLAQQPLPLAAVAQFKVLAQTLGQKEDQPQGMLGGELCSPESLIQLKQCFSMLLTLSLTMKIPRVLFTKR